MTNIVNFFHPSVLPLQVGKGPGTVSCVLRHVSTNYLVEWLGWAFAMQERKNEISQQKNLNPKKETNFFIRIQHKDVWAHGHCESSREKKQNSRVWSVCCFNVGAGCEECAVSMMVRLETWLIPSGTTRSRQYHDSQSVGHTQLAPVPQLLVLCFVRVFPDKKSVTKQNDCILNHTP